MAQRLQSNLSFSEKFSAHYASKFKVGKNCPLRKQVEFSVKENIKCKGFKIDPLGESGAEIESGILQKYKGRLLVLASNECAVHCRFCFRRNTKHKKIDDLPQKLAEILRKDKSIKEVILSGGDPLMLKHSELQAFFSAIPKHLNIRIHSRVPIAMPAKFPPILQSIGSRLIFVVHVNHPNELSKESKRFFERLAQCKATIFNQSVLLKGVNDNAQTLAELSEKLFSQGVLPYYLHSLDRVQGAAHFEVPLSKAKAIFKELKELLPGYLVPKFVREVRGEKSKVWVFS
ncbi:MAG: KamA family radical SAM protein [Fibromonadaceae bacterium]|jgi:EF-P beta-lysylation protein EpmB|nr:KamA family radical SAM protein [Fibromonadaceae bacterium]